MHVLAFGVNQKYITRRDIICVPHASVHGAAGKKRRDFLPDTEKRTSGEGAENTIPLTPVSNILKKLERKKKEIYIPGIFVYICRTYIRSDTGAIFFSSCTPKKGAPSKQPDCRDIKKENRYRYSLARRF